MGQNEQVNRIEAQLQPSVTAAAVNMYDRYINLAISDPSHPCKTMSFSDFLNQLIVRGMCSYNDQLQNMEKDGA